MSSHATSADGGSETRLKYEEIDPDYRRDLTDFPNVLRGDRADQLWKLVRTWKFSVGFDDDEPLADLPNDYLRNQFDCGFCKDEQTPCLRVHIREKHRVASALLCPHCSDVLEEFFQSVANGGESE